MKFEAAALYCTGEPLSLVEVVAGDLRPEEILVRMVGAGICHTDLTIQRGAYPIPLPIIPGHEGSGIVVQVGSAISEIVPGDPVALTFMSCGHCPRCSAGRPSYCEHFAALNMSGFRGDGTTGLCCRGQPIGGHFFGQSSFAQYSIAHRRNVVKTRRDAPLEMLGPFGCGIQTGAGAIFNTLRPTKNSRCLIFGAGGVGLSAVMAAKVLECSPIVVVEPQVSRRTLALELGATDAIDPHDVLMTAKLADLLPGGADVVVDTTGVAEIVSTAISLLARCGKLGLIGMHDMAAQASFTIVELLRKGASIHGIIEGDSEPQSFIPYLIDLFVEGRFPVDKLVRLYDFRDINKAIADQSAGAVIKPILTF